MNERSSTSENGNTEIQKCQDSANNNENKIDPTDDLEDANSEENISQKNVTLEALENTKVAVQFAAAALSKGANENSAKDLTMLQSALFTLQHQQVFQLQLIEQLQYQLAKSTTKKEKSLAKTSQLEEKEEKNVAADQNDDVLDDVFIKSLTKW